MSWLILSQELAVQCSANAMSSRLENRQPHTIGLRSAIRNKPSPSLSQHKNVDFSVPGFSRLLSHSIKPHPVGSHSAYGDGAWRTLERHQSKSTSNLQEKLPLSTIAKFQRTYFDVRRTYSGFQFKNLDKARYEWSYYAGRF